MSDLNKSTELYQLIAKRCKDSTFSEYQYKIYNEIIDLIKNCNSLEESANKIKNSKFYLAPSVALMQDKISAWKKAAIETNMDEVANVYEEKLKAIEKDNSEIYSAGYEQTAQNLKAEYINTMQAFANIFPSFISYMCTKENTHLEDIKKFNNQLSKPSNDFISLSHIEKFRNLIPVNDAFYQDYVKKIVEILSDKNIDDVNQHNDIEQEWQNVVLNKNKIIECARLFSDDVNYEKVTAIAPVYDSSNNIDLLKYNFKDDC